jgi:hypothetical protein
VSSNDPFGPGHGAPRNNPFAQPGRGPAPGGYGPRPGPGGASFPGTAGPGWPPAAGRPQPGGSGGFPSSGAPLPTGPSTTDSLTPARPPVALLILAGLLAVAGIVVAGVFWAGRPAVIGWALAGPLAIGAAAVFSLKDTARRAAPVYLSPGWLRAAYAAAAVLIVVGVIAGSVSFAIWVSHR